MPTSHESEQFIYDAIQNGLQNKPGPTYKWNSTQKLYEYSNTLYPNKNYTKTFDPDSFMDRGDVIHFGNDDYRNNNKMIFDGKKLINLDTDVDDYGGVPPDFVVGDNDGEFNIGDFSDVIDHNSINWLSKDKLKEIELYEKNGTIKGKVTIQNKLWKIDFEVHEDTEFNTGYGRHYSRKYKCILEDDNIYIDINPSTKYSVKSIEDQDNSKLVDLIKNNNEASIISHYGKNFSWFLYQVTKESKFSEYEHKISESKFPITWRKRGSSYDCETIILDQESFDRYAKNEKELDKVYINEIIGYPIKIEIIKNNNDALMSRLKEHINKLVENYDDVKKRHPVNYEGGSSLTMYL
jgi:hypothetical protein